MTGASFQNTQLGKHLETLRVVLVCLDARGPTRASGAARIARTTALSILIPASVPRLARLALIGKSLTWAMEHDAAVVVVEAAVLVLVDVLNVVKLELALLVEPAAVVVLLPSDAEHVKGSGPISSQS